MLVLDFGFEGRAKSEEGRTKSEEGRTKNEKSKI
jgi:hypothetical protein